MVKMCLVLGMRYVMNDIANDMETLNVSVTAQRRAVPRSWEVDPPCDGGNNPPFFYQSPLLSL